MPVSRRHILLGLISLPGCTALGALNEAATPLDTYALQPVGLDVQGARSSRNLMVVEPTASAAIATDRILIRTDALSVAYLPDARWAEPLPQMLQHLLVQSLASSGRIGFVGAQGAGPVPDVVLLTRIDAFEVSVISAQRFLIRIALEMTVLRDRDQRVLGTRQFEATEIITTDSVNKITRGFQSGLENMLPDALSWVERQAL